MVKTKFNLDLNLDPTNEKLSNAFSLNYEEALRLRINALNQVKRFIASIQRNPPSDINLKYSQFLNVYCSIADSVEEVLYLLFVSNQVFNSFNNIVAVEEMELYMLTGDTEHTTSESFMNLDLDTPSDELWNMFRLKKDRAKTLVEEGMKEIKTELSNDDNIKSIGLGLWKFIGVSNSLKELYYLTVLFSVAFEKSGIEL